MAAVLMCSAPAWAGQGAQDKAPVAVATDAMSEAEALAMTVETEAISPEAQAWFDRRVQAVESHLRGMAARGDARSLLLAAVMSPLVQEAGRPVPAAQWYARAAAMTPADPLLDWLQASDCPWGWQPCDREAAVARLERHAAGDMDTHLLALVVATARGDSAGARAQLHAAAHAAEHSQPGWALAQAMYAELSAVRSPALPAGVAAELGEDFGLGRAALLDDVAGVQAMAVWVAFAMPAYLPLTGMCRDTAPADSARREDCLRVFARMDQSGTLMDSRIAAVSAVRLLGAEGDVDDVAVWRERLRQSAWLLEHMTPGATPVDYFDRLFAVGERQARGDWMVAAGLARQAPEGWLPGDRRLRMLVQEGREPDAL